MAEQRMAPTGFAAVFGPARGRAPKDAQEVWDDALARIERDRLDLDSWLRGNWSWMTGLDRDELGGRWHAANDYVAHYLRYWTAPEPLDPSFRRLVMTHAELATGYPLRQRPAVHGTSRGIIAFHLEPLIGREPIDHGNGDGPAFDRSELIWLFEPLMHLDPSWPLPDSLLALCRDCRRRNSGRATGNLISPHPASGYPMLGLAPAN